MPGQCQNVKARGDPRFAAGMSNVKAQMSNKCLNVRMSKFLSLSHLVIDLSLGFSHWDFRCRAAAKGEKSVGVFHGAQRAERL